MKTILKKALALVGAIIIVIGNNSLVLASNDIITFSAEGDWDDTIIQNDETGIPDTALYKAMLRSADTNDDDILTVGEAEQCQSVKYDYLRDGTLYDLTGLEYCCNLTYLSIGDGGVTDITPLKTLVKLQYLNLSDNGIKDITPLSALAELQQLWLGGNHLTDVSALENLTGLQKLSLYRNELTDISPLKALINLQHLSLNNNELKSIDVLENLTNLTELYLQTDNVSDLSSISKLTKLETAVMYGKTMTDLSCLKDIETLTTLKLYGEEINVSDISSVKSLTISGSDLTICNLPALEQLEADCDGSVKLDNLPQIKYFSPNGITSGQVVVSNMEQLRSISVPYDEVFAVDISNTPNLKTIDLQDNKIAEFVIDNAPNVESLILNENQIKDISSLSGLVNLTTLDLRDNVVEDISSLSGLTKLKVLNLYDNNISKLPVDFKKSALMESVTKGNLVDVDYNFKANRITKEDAQNSFSQVLLDYEVDGTTWFVTQGFLDSADALEYARTAMALSDSIVPLMVKGKKAEYVLTEEDTNLLALQLGFDTEKLPAKIHINVLYPESELYIDWSRSTVNEINVRSDCKELDLVRLNDGQFSFLEHSFSFDHNVTSGIEMCTETDMAILHFSSGNRGGITIDEDYIFVFADEDTPIFNIEETIVEATGGAVEGFTIKNGVLTEITGAAVKNGEVIIPNSVHTIASGAAVSMDSIKTLIVPNNVKVIEENAFVSCGSVEEVYLSENLEFISDNAFVKDLDGFTMYIRMQSEAAVTYMKNYHNAENQNTGEIRFENRYDSNLWGNASISLHDANYVLQVALGINMMKENEIYVIDRNLDGVVNLSDANLVLKDALGIEY